MKSLLSRLGPPTLEHVVMAALVVAGMVAVAAPIGDNSMFVHLRTGVDMVTNWAIPRHDPYSFTANGEPWIVQSWLAEAIYGLLHRLGGDRLVILLHMLLGGGAVLLMVLLARATSMPRTLLAGLLPVLLTWLTWTQRPLMFAVFLFALVIYITVRRRSMWWLLPIGWLWVNTHGSFPIGVAWIVAFGLGERLDRGVFDRRTVRYGAFLLAGVLLGGINPLGPKILLFFTTAIGERAKSFADIVEWGSPSFHTVPGVVLAVVLAIVVAIGFRNRVAWRHLVPVLGLLVASLYSSRHLAMLAVAISPMLGALLSTEKRERVTPTASETQTAVISLVVVAFVALGIVARTFTMAPYSFDMYPITMLDRMRDGGLLNADTRLLSRETTSCYLIWRDGKQANVFMDDRIDMYPASVSTDYRHLYYGNAEPQPLLDKYQINVVLWDTDLPLSQVLSIDPKWRVAMQDEDHKVFVRN